MAYVVMAGEVMACIVVACMYLCDEEGLEHALVNLELRALLHEEHSLGCVVGHSKRI